MWGLIELECALRAKKEGESALPSPPFRTRQERERKEEKNRVEFQILTCSTASLTRPAASSSSSEDGEASSMGEWTKRIEPS